LFWGGSACRIIDFEHFPRIGMAYLLPHLHSGWEVDQAIVTEEDRVVVIRFGHDSDPTCMVQDEVLMSIADKVKNFAVIYLVDITEVPDFNNMYELYDDCTTMFFHRNKVRSMLQNLNVLTKDWIKVTLTHTIIITMSFYSTISFLPAHHG
jgi:hypothetical protein